MIEELKHWATIGHWPVWGNHDGLPFCWACIRPPKPRRKDSPWILKRHQVVLIPARLPSS